MKKLDFIQALRGIAAMLVVLYHCRTYLNFSFYNLGSFLFDSGSIGVDLFFMISGFIMVYTTHDKVANAKTGIQFILKRIIRIVPLYWICTLLFMWISVGEGCFTNIEGWKFIARGLFFIPMDLHASGPFFGYAPLFTGWTLNYEMLFYLMFGLSLFFKNLRWYLFFAFFTIFVFIIPSLDHSLNLDPFANHSFAFPILNFLCNPILLDFVFGVGLGYLYLSNFTIKDKITLKTLPLFAIAFFGLQYFGGFETGHGIAKFGLSCGLLFFSLTLYVKEYSLTVPKWMVFLGDISYSLYITHLVVLAFFEILLNNIHLNFLVERPVCFIPLIAGIVAFSYLTAQLIEKKLSKYLNRILFKDQK